MTTTLSALPAGFAAGTTVAYTKGLSDYAPSAGWALSVRLVGTSSTLSAVVSVVDDAYVVTLAADDTADLSAGTYRWVERVTKGDDVYNVGTGFVEVWPDLGAATAGAARSRDERLLDLVNAALDNRLPSGMENYAIAGRSISRIPISELFDLRDRIAARVSRKRSGSRTIGRTVRARFPSTGGER